MVISGQQPKKKKCGHTDIIINESQILTKKILSSDLSRANPIISDVNR